MTLRLGRFRADLQLIRNGGLPSASFIRTLNDAFAQIEAAFNGSALAQQTAEDAAHEAARINSYTVPTSVLSASDAGSNATITISGHLRVYPVQGSIDLADLTVAGGSLTGLSYSTGYYVYYDDTTLEDATPAYAATTSAATAQVGAAAGRHFVGFITTPASGGGGTSGTGGSPPGGGGGNPIP